jgi:murein DD-endopeptidase MepM/ murein hydrolase activator NlpD
MVLYSGWVNADWGYGILVVLDHGNGWTTYYAHLSQTYVSCGQVISRGSPLGAVGSTGNSSGPHVHFEMRWGHNPDNPAFYVGF